MEATEEAYIQILKDNGIDSKVVKVEIKAPDFTGDQFASQVETVTITFDEDGKEPLELFVKKVAGNGEFAAQMSEVLMFEKEVVFFGKLLPDLEKFVKSQPGYDGFLEGLFPKCYHATDNFIVFENLVTQGFSILNKRVHHDFDVTTTVMKKLAYLHGSGMAFIQEIGLDEFNSRYPQIGARTVWSEEGEIVNGTWTQNSVDGALKILRSNSCEGSEEALKFFEKYEQKAFLKLCPQYKTNNQACALSLNHGDCWNGNVMFKLDSNKKPSKAILIDLQTVHLGSPALDLQFYHMYATEPALRRNHWRDFLRSYYDTLAEVVTKLGKEMQFSFEDLLSDFQSKCETGFFFGLYMVYGFEALEHVGDVVNDGGHAMENLSLIMSKALDSLILEKGTLYAEGIVKSLNEYLEIKSANIKS